ncbi:hypothetical protein [Streptomyces sp. 2112.3]|nr:hypothetical protein [Streptomyces sp. 2112.3]
MPLVTQRLMGWTVYEIAEGAWAPEVEAEVFHAGAQATEGHDR